MRIKRIRLLLCSYRRIGFIVACLLPFLIPAPAFAMDCGEPNWDRKTDVGVFVWQDCASNRYEMRVVVGGLNKAVTYSGQVMTESPFVGGINPVSQESADTFDKSDPVQIDFALKTSSPWYDGFNFKLATNTPGCFAVDWTRSGSPPVYAGQNRAPVTLPFDLETLGACQDETVRIEASAISASEADSEAVFTLGLSAASVDEIRVDVATADGSAMAGSDYTAFSSTLIFAPGETNKTVTIALLQDSLPEGTEQFSLLLSQAVNAQLSTPSVIATLYDDEISACGEPLWNRKTDTGVIMWQDCSSDLWQVRVVSASLSNKATFAGALESDLPLTQARAINQESKDVFDLSDPQQLVFELINKAPWLDGFEFAVTAGSVNCFEIAATSPGNGTVLVGPDRTPLTSPFSLETLGACKAPPGRITVSDVTVSEADAQAIFTVALSAASVVEVTVEVATADGTATAENDYDALISTVTFVPGKISQTVAVSLINDTDNENPETFSLVLSNPVNGDIVDDTATATIRDDEISTCGQPDFSATTNQGLFVWQDCSQTEHWSMRYRTSSPTILNASLISDEAYLNITQIGLEGQDKLTTPSPQVIDLQWVGDNTADGVDIISAPGAALCLVADSVYYGAAETLAVAPLNVNTLSSCLVIKPAVKTLSVSEADVDITLTVSLSAESTDVVTVDYQSIDGSAQANADYVPVTGTLIFPPTETVQTITVPLLQDSLSEATETFTLVLSNVGNAYLASAVTTVSILDDDIAICGVPSYNKSTEKGLFVWKDCQTNAWFVRNTGGGDSNGVFYIGEVTHDQGFIDVTGFGLENNDSVDSTTDSTVIDFLLKVWNGGEDGFQFTPVSDAGTCVELLGPSGVPVLVGPNKQQVLGSFDLSTLDVCQAPPGQITVSDVTVSEADAQAVFTVALSAASADEVTVDVATADGTATAANDYDALISTVTFAPGETSQTVAVSLINDTDNENPETFSLVLSNPVNGDIVDDTATATIRDDEISTCGQPDWSTSTNEGLFVWQDCSQADSWHARYAASSGTIAGAFLSHDAFLNVVAVNIEAQDTVTNSPASMIDFNWVADSLADGIDFSLSPGAQICLDLNGQTIFYGAEQTPAVTPFNLKSLTTCHVVKLSNVNPVLSEADADSVLRVELYPESTDTVSVDYRTLEGGAQENADYVMTTGSILFLPTETTHLFSVPLLQDLLSESTENFAVELSNVSNAFLANRSVTINIIDDEIDVCGEPAWDRKTDTGVILWKDCSSGVWQVRVVSASLSNKATFAGALESDLPLTQARAINQESKDVFDLSDPQQLVFELINKAPWLDGFEFAVTAGSVNCFEVEATSPGNGMVLVGPDRTPLVSPFSLETLVACQAPHGQIIISDIIVNEADTDAVFTLELTSPSDVEVSVEVATVDGTAVAASDYEAISNLIIFNPGEIEKTVSVPLLQDILSEGPERFTLILSQPVNAEIGIASAEAQIQDDEVSACGKPDFDASSESGIFIWRDCSTDNRWHVRTVAGNGSRYINFSVVLIADQNITDATSFTSGSTQTLNGSDDTELNYQFLTVAGEVNGFDFNLIQGANSCLHIDFPASPALYVGASRNAVTLPLHLGTLENCRGLSISINDVVLSEADATAQFTVSLPGANENTVTVDYSTVTGSATGGDDFVEVLNRQLVFLSGETSKTVSVPIIQDLLGEGSEEFSVILSNASNALIKDANGQAIIIDDEITNYGSVDCAAIDVTASASFSSNKPKFTYKGKVRDPHIARQADGGNPYTYGLSLFVPDGVSVNVPGLVTLVDQPLIKCGYVDVTQPPFNADSSGEVASAANNVRAINAAMDFARQYMLATYFPVGSYIVNDKLECTQGLSGKVSADTEVREDPYGACLIMGSNVGPERPIIVLQDNSPGYQNEAAKKPLLSVWTRSDRSFPNQINVGQPNIGFHNMVIGLDFDLGLGNSGAVAIDLDGAQGSGVEDVTIEVNSGYAGLTALAGAAGATHNIHIIGGKYGIDTIASGLNATYFSDTRSLGSTPLISGSTFTGQTVSAIRYKQQETLVLVGVRIEPDINATDAAIVGAGGNPSTSFAAGHLVIVDSEIIFAPSALVKKAITTNRSLYLKNVYTENAEQIVDAAYTYTPRSACGGGAQVTSTHILTGNSTGWRHTQEYAASLKVHQTHKSNCYQFRVPVYIDGVVQASDDYHENGGDIAPPADLIPRHQWHNNSGLFPHWEMTNVINVKDPLRAVTAVGDGQHDDTLAIQTAIYDAQVSGAIIFLPKGYYRVTKTIDLDSDTVLIGAGRHLSIIAGEIGTGGDFLDTLNPEPVLRSADSAGGRAVLALLGIFHPHEVPGAYALNWRTGQHSIVRTIDIINRSRIFSSNEILPTTTQLQITGNGGGRWYTLNRDTRYIKNWPASESFSWMRVDGTSQPLSFYTVNPEGASDQGYKAYTKFAITNSSNVNIYAYKDEGFEDSLAISDSDNIALYGFGGLPAPIAGRQLIRVDNSTNLTFAGLLIRGTNDHEHGQWSAVSNQTPNGGPFFQTIPSDLPILYKH